MIKQIFEECREKLTLLLHPIAPHMSEEIWEMIGKDGYVSLASWPSYDEKLLTEENDVKWKLMNNIVDDVNNIILVMKQDQLNKISIIIANEWKFKFYSTLMSLLNETRNQGELMKKLMKEADLKPHGKDISQHLAKILKNVGKYSKISLSSENEYQFFQEIKPILSNKYQCSIQVAYETESKEKKANQALPGRPAIILS